MYKIIDPSSGDTLREIDIDTPESIAAKAERAREERPAWTAVPLDKRKDALSLFGKLLLRDKDRLARTLTSETGKPITQSLDEIGAVGGRLEFFLDKAAAAMADRTPHKDDGMEERISQEPLGVLANISAWNYPYFVGTNVFIPALLTGNAVLYKPSEFALLTGLEIAALMLEAGVPSDTFVPVLGGGSAGADLLSQDLDGVFFTGSYATGLKVAEAAAKRLMKVQLELGGKDPVYVADDADPIASAKGLADGAFYNNGQSCCAVERLYVHAAILDDFVEAFVETVRSFKMGDPSDAGTYIGPLTRAAQIGVLESQIEEARKGGAKILCGGRRADRPGNYFEPTVLTDVTHKMSLMREESFGPVIGIQAVDDDEEAVRRMNDTNYGLTAGIYTKSKERAENLLRRIDAGTVYWNCCDRVSPRLPWSGRRHSGLGVTLSEAGIAAFLRPKAWHLKS